MYYHPPDDCDAVDKAAVQSLFKSWNLSTGVCVLLNSWGINQIKHLEGMEYTEVDFFLKNIDSCGFFGDRVLFLNGLKKWRKDRVNKSYWNIIFFHILFFV